MSLPSFAPFPPASVRKEIVPKEWDLCLDSWLLLAQGYNVQPSEKFLAQAGADSPLVDFLKSYVAAQSIETSIPSPKSRALRKACFILLHRTFTELVIIPPALLDWHFLAGLSIVYSKSQTLKTLLEHVWHRQKLSQTSSILGSKTSLATLLEKGQPDAQSEKDVFKVMAFSRACYPYSQFLMIGSDFIDSIIFAYDRKDLIFQRKKLVALLYVCLASLMSENDPKTSNLLDQLYGLKSTSLLKALIESTPFLAKFERQVSVSGKESGRAKPIMAEFAGYTTSKPKNPIRRKIDKGKTKANDNHGHRMSGQLHVHKISLVSQIQDLFPDLGSGFIIRLLDEYNDDTERITAHLLDNDLPTHLQQADRSEIFDVPSSADDKEHHGLPADLAPHSTPPLLPTRRNIYDDDDFDKLAIDASQLHLGRKNKDLTADRLLASGRPSNQKAAILSALAAFDADDDERDDTYDAEDVGGTIDTTYGDEDKSAKTNEQDQVLFNAYKTTPDLFQRDGGTRRGQARMALRNETGMTDEAIEGWAIMLSRDPGRLKYLERQQETRGAPQQRALEGTAWKGDSGADTAEDSDFGASRGRGRGPGNRGRGRGGRGSGAVAGPSGEQDTQVARQRKDAQKGSRANHNRRDQRARKMARGGFPG